MKKLISAIIAFSIFGLFGCDPASQYPVSFKVNGSAWYASSAPTILSGGRIYINANSITQGQNPVSFSIADYAVVDTFDLDSATNAFLFGASVSSGYYAKANNPATIIIKQFSLADKHIVAEFFGRLYTASNSDSVLITDGKFDLHYQD